MYTKIIAGLCIFIVALCGCDKKDLPYSGNIKDNRIHLSQAKTTFYAAVVNQRTPAQSDSLYGFPVTATFSGSGFQKAPEDIAVNFELDYSTWDSINAVRQEAGNAPFERIPDSVFTFTQTRSIIPRGADYSDIARFFISARKLKGGRNYMIPVRLRAVSGGVPVYNARTIAYYVISLAAPVPLPSNGWTVIETNSEETVGEGEANGRARFVLDGYNNTFWHTRYVGGVDQLPHYLVVDMLKNQTILGLNITGRNGSPTGNPNVIDVTFSDDGKSWKSPVAFELDNVYTTQVRYFATAQNGRYMKLTVRVTMGNTPFTYLSEVAAF